MLMPGDNPLAIGFNVPFVEAIAAAKLRAVVLPDIYYGELQGIARQLAFSIASVTSYDQLKGVMDSLSARLETGQSFEAWKQEVAVQDLKLPEHRLDNIFRTNLQGNYMAGKWEKFERNKKTRPFLMYDAVNDSRVRVSHLALDGTIRPVDDAFWADHSPPNGYRSILPNQPISGQFMLGLKARYSGPSVEIITESGNTLSLTTNHPVLTNRGWVFANELTKNDTLIRYRVEIDECSNVSSNSNNQNAPSTAEDVFNSMREHGSAFAPRIAFDLDGDIEFIQGDVEVVASNSILLGDILSEFSEFACQIELARTNCSKIDGPGYGDLLSIDKFLSDFASSNPSLFSKSFNAVSLDAGRVGVGFDPVLFQVLRDPISGYSKLGSYFSDSGAGNVFVDDIITNRFPGFHRGRKPAFTDSDSIYLGLGPLCDSRISNVPIGGHVTNSESHSDLIKAHPGLIHFDHVADIRFSHFSGHVYDFQTKTGLIVSHNTGLVVSNCRCSLISLTADQAMARTGPNKGLEQEPALPNGDPALPDTGWDYNPHDRMGGINSAIKDKFADATGGVMNGVLFDALEALVAESIRAEK
jgi:SPP1 gp7 family putative phage head morphogenesis protein